MTTTARRVLRLETTARRRGGPRGGLCDDDRLALLADLGCIAYAPGCILVADDVPDEVRAWLVGHAPDGYAVA